MTVTLPATPIPRQLARMFRVHETPGVEQWTAQGAHVWESLALAEQNATHALDKRCWFSDLILRSDTNDPGWPL